MSKTTDVSKLNHQQLRKEYKSLVKQVEKSRTWGDFLHNLCLLLQVPKYSVWRATKFDVATGKPTELTLKSQPKEVRSWDWHPTVSLQEEFSIPEEILKELKTQYNLFVKSKKSNPTLFYGVDRDNYVGRCLLVTPHMHALHYNANESPSYAQVLRFLPIVSTESFFLSSDV